MHTHQFDAIIVRRGRAGLMVALYASKAGANVAVGRWELGILLDLAEVTAISANNRKESRSHSREDFINRDNANCLVHTLAYRKSDDPYSVDAPPAESNIEKKVDMSLAPEDTRFRPKELMY